VSTDSDVAVVVAGGLGAIKPGAEWYYRRLCSDIGAELVTPYAAGFGPANLTYEHFEAELDRLSLGGQQIVIVGHSLGGVNAVRYAARHSNVARLMLIGVPVLGSAWLKYVSHFREAIEIYAPILLDLSPTSGFLTTFNDELLRVAHMTTCVEARFDLFVLPNGACHVPGAHDYLWFSAPWVNHVTLIAHRRVRQRAADVVAEANRLLASL